MKILPEITKIKEYSAGGQYKVMPVYTELLSDFITPIETLKV